MNVVTDFGVMCWKPRFVRVEGPIASSRAVAKFCRLRAAATNALTSQLPVARGRGLPGVAEKLEILVRQLRQIQSFEIAAIKRKVLQPDPEPVGLIASAFVAAGLSLGPRRSEDGLTVGSVHPAIHETDVQNVVDDNIKIPVHLRLRTAE
jgi:hypothetical protein